ncbi:MAG: hypothetical protein ACXVA9_05760 [Bdellovibrionales bacterium]
MRIAGRLYLLLMLVLGTSVHAKSLNVCEILLSSGQITKPATNLSQAQRINEMLTKLTPEKRKELYAALGTQNLTDIARDIRSDKLSPQQKALLDANPGLDMAVQDLSDFGNIFPGIFALADPDLLVLKVIGVVRQQEVDSKVAHIDLLQSESMAPRLRRTIDNSLINLIEQAEMEYEGNGFGKSTFQKYWYELERIVFPSYKKVKQIIEYSQEFEKQLTRLQLVDRLIIKLALSDAASLGLTDAEVEKLTMQVLRSPKEIGDIEKEMTKILGTEFKTGQEAEIGKFDILKSYAITDKKNWPDQLEKFDQVNLAALELLNEQLNAARVRKGMQPRNMQQFDLIELQLYYEAHERRVELYTSEYQGWTSQTANESYTVEDQHTRQVPDGTDKDGKTKYKTETYYTDRTVHPSFENLLSNQYDRGDRSVSGLSQIQDRVHSVYFKELGPRNLIAETESLVDKVLAGYEPAVTMDKGRDVFMQNMAEQIGKLQTSLKDLNVYIKWSPEQVEKQYSKDDYKNFQARNGWMIKRMENAIKLLTELAELMRRRQPQLTPIFDMFDYTNWLGRLRRIRTRNFINKGVAAGVPVSGAALYNLVPQAQMTMDQWMNGGVELIHRLIGP